MNRRNLLLLSLMLFLLFSGVGDAVAFAADDKPSVDAMLSNYEHARGREKRQLARQLMDRFLADDVFFTPPPALHDHMPSDSLDALVWYGATFYYYCNSNDSLFTLYGERALPLLENSYKTLYVSSLINLARYQYRAGNSQRTIDMARQAIAICKEIDDKRNLSRAYSTLAMVYTGMKQGREAVDNSLLALSVYQQSGDTLITHSILSTVSEAYSILGDYENSIIYGKRCVQAARRHGSSPRYVASCMTSLAYAYYQADSLTACKNLLKEAFRLLGEEPDVQISTNAHQYMGVVYMKEHKPAMAAQHFRLELQYAEQRGDRRDQCNLQHNLYEALRDISPQEALQALERYSVLHDSVYNEDLQTKLSQASASFHNDQLRAENETTRRTNRIILITGIIIFLLTLAIIAALFYAVRTRSRSMRRLREVQKSREMFFTNVTHEFRTPLTIILGMAAKLRASLSSLHSPLSQRIMTTHRLSRSLSTTAIVCSRWSTSCSTSRRSAPSSATSSGSREMSWPMCAWWSSHSCRPLSSRASQCISTPTRQNSRRPLCPTICRKS